MGRRRVCCAAWDTREPDLNEILLYALGVLVFALAMVLSIGLHEAGHFFFAKRYGVRVTQFMIGFGPTLWSRKKGETEYGVKAVPLGGFVKMIGMLPPGTKEQERIAAGLGESVAARKARRALEKSGKAAGASKDAELVRGSSTGMFISVISSTRAGEFELVEPEDKDRLFYRLPARKKAMVMLAGPMVNLLLAFGLFWGAFGTYGERAMEPTGSTVVALVSDCAIVGGTGRDVVCTPEDPASPAKQLGIEVGDRIVSYNGTAVQRWDDLTALVHANKTGQATVVVQRGDQELTLGPASTAVRVKTEDGSGAEVGYLGVGPESVHVVHRLGPVAVLGKMAGYTTSTVSTISKLPERTWGVLQAITGQAERSPDSPMSVIGGSRVAGEIAATSNPGFDVASKSFLLAMIIASFNLFIGIFNLIPLMPLDGGHIGGALWEGIRNVVAKLRGLPRPRPVDVGKQLPVAMVLMMAFAVMSIILMLGDIIVPIKTGL